MKDLTDSTGTTDGACHCRSNVELPWLRICSSNEESRSSSGTPSVEQAFPLNWSDRQPLPSCPPLTTAHVKEKGVTAFQTRKCRPSQLHRLWSACWAETHPAGALAVTAHTVDDLKSPGSSELDGVQKQPVGVPGPSHLVWASTTAHPTQEKMDCLQPAEPLRFSPVRGSTGRTEGIWSTELRGTAGDRMGQEGSHGPAPLQHTFL